LRYKKGVEVRGWRIGVYRVVEHWSIWSNGVYGVLEYWSIWSIGGMSTLSKGVEQI